MKQYSVYTVWVKKRGNPNFISNLWRTKRRITKLISGNDTDSTIISLSYDTLVMHIGYQMTAQQ